MVKSNFFPRLNYDGSKAASYVTNERKASAEMNCRFAVVMMMHQNWIRNIGLRYLTQYAWPLIVPIFIIHNQ